jgi:hypothetical protein
MKSQQKEKAIMVLEAGDSLPTELLERVRNRARFQVLYFMRTADCAVCRTHVRRLLALGPTLQALGAELTLFAPDERAPEWAATNDAPLVLGPAAYRSAGFERTLGAVQQSGTVIARDGKILAVRRATLPFQAFDERELVRLLQSEPQEQGAAAIHAT